eukprot:767646-Hanusia_phi.AAC.2
MNDAEQEEALGKECLSGSSSGAINPVVLLSDICYKHANNLVAQGQLAIWLGSIKREMRTRLSGSVITLACRDPVICKDSLTAATAQGRMDEIKRNQAG